MAFTIFRADGTDELLSSEVGISAANAATTIYDEDGLAALVNVGIGNYQYLSANNGWQSKIHSPDDTLVTGSGNDFLVWDSDTTSNLTFSGAARDRLQTSNASRLLRLVDLGAGDDVVNFTYRETGLTPGAYSVGATIYGGDGNDLMAFGAAADTAYGGADSDSIWGGGGDDLMVGGAGVDSLYGGSGSDQFIAEIDAVAADGDFVVGWEGIDNADPITIALTAGDQLVADYAFGGTTLDPEFILPDLDTDILYMQMPENTPGARNVLTLSANGAFQPQFMGIEIIVASAAADIVNLSWFSGGEGFAYDQDVSVFAGDGNDIVFGGDGNDRIVGDQTGGLDGFSDTLFGGRGRDTIFGDGDADQPGAADTIFGGYGNDTGFGGAGDDVLIDHFDGNYYGGLGQDLIFVHFSDRGEAIIEGGPEDTSNGTDGSDRIYITGVYDQVDAELGQGDDIYISFADENSEIGSGARRDIVYGGSGNDLVSSWYGDDTIFGGPGDDVIWSGDGNDLVFGGDGFDLIYIETGVDQVYGGAGEDYYFAMMGEIQFADIYDEAREGLVDSSSNKLLLGGAFVFDGIDEDGLLDGAGLYDLDHDLETVALDEEGNPLDPLLMSRVEGEEYLWQIEHLNTGAIVFFDQRDIDGIALFNNDTVGPAPPGYTFYMWSDAEQTYVFTPA